MNVRLAVVLAVLSLGAGGATAQGRPAAPPVDSALVRVRLRDGSNVVGHVVASDSIVVLVTPSGSRLEFSRTAVRSWAAIRGTAKGGVVVYDDPNTSRIFFAPTGRTLARGEGYFADYFLVYPFIGYAVHDRLTLSGGVSIVPGVTQQAVYAGPKIGVVRSANLNAAVGGGYATILGEKDDEGWTGYAAVTVGRPDLALTATGGYFKAPEDDGAFGILAGEARISGRAKLLVEGWVFEDVTDVPVVFGMRFFGERLAVDFGLLHVIGLDTDEWPFIPWVDFVVNW